MDVHLGCDDPAFMVSTACVHPLLFSPACTWRHPSALVFESPHGWGVPRGRISYVIGGCAGRVCAQRCVAVGSLPPGFPHRCCMVLWTMLLL